MKRIRKDDTVIITAGKSKGHVGKVTRVLEERLVIEGGNLIKKHVKPNPQLNVEGGIVSMEASIHVSNVSLYNTVTQKADRVGFRFIEKDGKKYKVRYFKSNNEVVDLV